MGHYTHTHLSCDIIDCRWLEQELEGFLLDARIVSGVKKERLSWVCKECERENAGGC